MRDTFVRTLIDLAKQDSDIELVTGDLGFGVLKPFWEQLPNQLTNAGIAEQNMTSMAAGMALEGKTVFTYSIGNFPTLRCLEQVRNDCAYHHANVKIVCIGGGFVYGSLGMSHQATEDIAIMRALPDVAVLCPGDAAEAEAATRAIAAWKGTCYLRLGRGGERRVHDHIDNYQLGKALKIRETCGATRKRSAAVFSTGAILDVACDTAVLLEEAGVHVIQYSFPTVKPLDEEVIRACAEQTDLIVTVEEHSIIGGLGGAAAEVMAENGSRARLLRIGLEDLYCTTVGSQKYLRGQYGMTAESAAARALKILNR